MRFFFLVFSFAHFFECLNRYNFIDHWTILSLSIFHHNRLANSIVLSIRFLHTDSIDNLGHFTCLANQKGNSNQFALLKQ